MSIVRPQASLNMTNGNMEVKGSQGRSKRRRGVSVHEHYIRSYILENRLATHHYIRCNVEQSLARLHYLEIKVRNHLEYIKNLFEHFSMLTSVTY